MGRVRRKAGSFPPEFGQLLYHVGSTKQTLLVDNLGEERQKYTAFIARVHEFRRAYHEEALASADPEKMRVSELYYGVTVHNPQQVNGKWVVKVAPKDSDFGSAIGKLLGTDDVTPRIPSDRDRAAGSQGAQSIEDYLEGGDEDKT